MRQLYNVVYQPRGRAAEYADLACNLFRGCEHWCRYCYAPEALHIERADFMTPSFRPGLLDCLERDARRYAGDPRHVLLCFTCDPYQPFDRRGITRSAIQILHKHGLRVSILTKGGLLALRDMDLLTPEDRFGVTLTYLDGERAIQWEPRAAAPHDRVYSLFEAHKAGVPTWVSLEPVLDADQAVEIIQRTCGFVDEYRVGKLNHATIDIDWAAAGRRIVEELERRRCRYYIKRDLALCMEGGPHADSDGGSREGSIHREGAAAAALSNAARAQG